MRPVRHPGGKRIRSVVIWKVRLPFVRLKQICISCKKGCNGGGVSIEEKREKQPRLCKLPAEGKNTYERIHVAREIQENQDNAVEAGTQGRMESKHGKSYPVIENV